MQDLKDNKGLSLFNLTKDHTNMLKGIGMLCIVLHNFFHWTHVVELGENEFFFDSERVYNYIHTVIAHPDFSLSALFSFWGHFGVQLFIFASGYGLAKQFMKKKPVSYKNYIVPKLIKIYGLLLVGLLCYFILVYPNLGIKFDRFIKFVTSSLLLSNNFSTSTLFSYPFSGTWWYFSLAVQLYLIFPLLYYIVDKYKEKGFFILMVASYVLIYLLLPIAKEIKFPVYANFTGHIPELLLGVGLARFKDFRLGYKTIFPVALLVFVLSNFFEVIHPLGFLSVTILALMLLCPLYNKLPQTILNSILFIGGISMFIFIINSPLRSYTIPLDIVAYPQWMIILKAVVHLLFAISVSYFISIIYNKYITPQLNKLTGFIVRN